MEATVSSTEAVVLKPRFTVIDNLSGETQLRHVKAAALKLAKSLFAGSVRDNRTNSIIYGEFYATKKRSVPTIDLEPEYNPKFFSTPRKAKVRGGKW